MVRAERGEGYWKGVNTAGWTTVGGWRSWTKEVLSTREETHQCLARESGGPSHTVSVSGTVTLEEGAL